jgi:signal transduction histidine kinase
VAVKGVLELRGNMFHVDLQPQPPDFLHRLPLGPLRPGEADVPILGIFELAIQGLDESWIEPEGTQGYAERLDERTHMLAALSHDLRTSLTGLLLDAEDMTGGDSKDRLIAGLEEMDRVISATLAFAGDDLKGEPAQMIDLAALLISLCDSFSDRNCSASYSGPDHLLAMCQPVAIKRALTNLIDNAVKYGGCARVQLGLGAEGAAITIADDGPGIPADKADLALKPFGRLDYARNRESGGVGLGLTIARDIVQSHGGEVRLGVPSQGKGFEVLLSLPLPSSVPV